MSWITGAFAGVRVPLAMVLALTVCGGGCRSDPEGRSARAGRPGDDFLRDDETSAVTRIAEQQIAVGARTDATLRPYHFDHAGLNALGREKLDLMLASGDGQRPGELVVYVDIAGDGANRRHAGARHAEVTDYLTSRGLAEGEFRLESGFNPHNTMSAVSAVPRQQEAGQAPEGGDGAMPDGAFGPPADMIPTR